MKITKKDIKDVGHIILFIITLYFGILGIYTYTYDHITCNYVQTFSMINETTIKTMTMNELKYSGYVETNGMYNQNIILNTQTQKLKRCKWKW